MDKQRGHFVVLDGMRGLAALAVAAIHLSQAFALPDYVPRAHLAVDFFFMLSGFVISYAYDRRLSSGMQLADFAKIRLIRLYPLVFVGVILGVVSKFLDPAGGFSALSILGAALFAFAMLPLPRLGSNRDLSAFPINGPLWSLSYELLSNLVYAALAPRLSTRLLQWAAIPLSLALIAISIRFDGISAGVAWGWTMLAGLVRVFCPFTIGILIFRHFNNTASERRGSFQVPKALLASAILMLALATPIYHGQVYDAVAVLVVFPLVIILGINAQQVGKLAPAFAWLGSLSYPLYIINQPVFNILAGTHFRFGREENTTLTALSSFVLCIIISLFLQRAYDEPVRKWLRAATAQPILRPMFGFKGLA